ncbi:HAMP domain-containing sensor histidine kinase [Streptomyces albiaxialis]|uniref:histidine kinase n=1 Tax=Streptomyces albiaxialis TaxID=329523 RepID=A0ABP5H2L3_9ACTN
MTERDVPLRRSLLLRLLAVSALVSVCSVAATGWVVVRTTAVAIREERGQALADDARIYDALLGHAAAHRDWNGAGPLVDRLAARTGHRVVLRDKGGRTVADSDPEPGRAYRPPDRPTAVVDPLAVDPQLLPEGAADGIDPRAVGPFRLPADERARLRAYAAGVAECRTAARGVRARVEVGPSGRPRVVTSRTEPSATDPSATDQSATDPSATDPSPVPSEAMPKRPSRAPSAARSDVPSEPPGGLGRPSKVPAPAPPGSGAGGAGRGDGDGDHCGDPRLDAPTPTETKALRALNSLVNSCLSRRGEPDVRLELDGSWQPSTDRERAGSARVASCLATSRSQQLASYVAPAVRLYVGSTGRSASTFFDLSPGNKLRIAGGAALVLLVTVAVTALAGVRLVRPLRKLTRAARRMEDGDVAARVEVTGGDEIARLSAAFNAMSARRAQLEAARKAMTSDVAHELRTPLSNIRGWLEAVEDGLADPDPELVSSLLGQALLLQHVIDDLRDLAEAEAGALRLEREPVGVAELLRATAVAHRAAAEAAGVTLRVAEPGEGTEDLDADPVRLRQALGNLVTNAVRHTPERGTVTLRARSEDGAVALEVADTGTGIAPGELPHVFDRFWRAEKSRGRSGGGSGLGLAIVRKLAEAHGGTVTAASTPGQGSVFVLRLPAGRGAQADCP